MPALRDFSLVGGTALSLRYGHRTSVDLDLFHHVPFENTTVVAALEKEFGPLLDYRGHHVQFGVFCFIDGVKVDIVHYPHGPIAPMMVESGVRM